MPRGCCDDRNLDGSTITDLRLVEPTIVGGTIDGSVLENVRLGSDCDGAAVMSGASIATCANVDNKVRNALTNLSITDKQIAVDCQGAPIYVNVATQLATCRDLVDLHDALIEYVDEHAGGITLYDCGGRLLQNGDSVASCSDLSNALSGLNISGKQIALNCQGAPIYAGATTMLATCGDLTNAISNIDLTGKLIAKDCDGTGIYAGENTVLATCRDLTDAIESIPGAMFYDCSGRLLTGTNQIPICSDIGYLADEWYSGSAPIINAQTIPAGAVQQTNEPFYPPGTHIADVVGGVYVMVAGGIIGGSSDDPGGLIRLWVSTDSGTTWAVFPTSPRWVYYRRATDLRFSFRRDNTSEAEELVWPDYSRWPTIYLSWLPMYNGPATEETTGG